MRHGSGRRDRFRAGLDLSLARSADQIHTDIAYNDVNVRLIGTHAGVTAGGGPTHNCIADLALYHAIPNLTVVVPADAGQSLQGDTPFHDLPRSDGHPDRPGGSPNVYADDSYDFEIGKAIETVPDDITLISTRRRLLVYDGRKKLREEHGISARVIDMHTVKPLDTEMLFKCARETGNIITVEEHSINGGLGGPLPSICLKRASAANSSESACRMNSRFSAIWTKYTHATAWIRRV